MLQQTDLLLAPVTICKVIITGRGGKLNGQFELNVVYLRCREND